MNKIKITKAILLLMLIFNSCIFASENTNNRTVISVRPIEEINNQAIAANLIALNQHNKRHREDVEAENEHEESSEDASDEHEELTPSGYKKAKCDEFGKNLNEIYLKKHLRMHNNEKHYCTVENCNKSYILPQNLKDHMNKHTGTTPYKCSFPGCTKSFAARNSQKRHFKRHTQKQDDFFKCDYCNQTFTQKANCQRHMNAKHLNVRYQCPHCERSFSVPYNLKNHINTHHAQNGENNE